MSGTSVHTLQALIVRYRQIAASMEACASIASTRNIQCTYLEIAETWKQLAVAAELLASAGPQTSDKDSVVVESVDARRALELSKNVI